jgi:hypothetical protein
MVDSVNRFLRASPAEPGNDRGAASPFVLEGPGAGLARFVKTTVGAEEKAPGPAHITVRDPNHCETMANGGGTWWVGASAAARERASRKRAFYAVHFGADGESSSAPVRWLHVRPSVFWDCPSVNLRLRLLSAS